MINNASLYGMGQGEAQVLPSNPIIPMLRQQQAQEQQKREAQANAVASQLQKINFDKTRNADLPDLMAGYNDIKDTYNQSLATQDPAQKVALQNQLAQKQMLLQQHIANSQQALEHERTIGNLSLNPNAHLKDDFSDNYNKLTGLPLSSPDYQKQAGYFNSPFDAPNYDLNGATQKLLKISQTPVDNGYTTGTLKGGIKQVYENKGSNLNKDQFLQNTLNQMNDDRDFRRTLMKSYGGNGITDPVDVANNYTNKIYEQHKDDLSPSKHAIATQLPQRSAPLSQEFIYKRDNGLLGANKNPIATPSYNVLGNISRPHTDGTTSVEPVTSPVEIDAGNLKGAVVPNKVYNTETGYATPNTDARNITSAKIRLVPVSASTGNLLSDGQVQQANNGNLVIAGNKNKLGADDVKYQYMVYGTEKKKEPVMTTDNDGKKIAATDANGAPKFQTVDAPVAFSANNLTNDKFNNKIDYQKIESNLPQAIRDKIVKQNQNTSTEPNNMIYKATTGKSYSHADLLKMGYSEDQIKQALQLGNLK